MWQCVIRSIVPPWQAQSRQRRGGSCPACAARYTSSTRLVPTPGRETRRAADHRRRGCPIPGRGRQRNRLWRDQLRDSDTDSVVGPLLCAPQKAFLSPLPYLFLCRLSALFDWPVLIRKAASARHAPQGRSGASGSDLGERRATARCRSPQGPAATAPLRG